MNKNSTICLVHDNFMFDKSKGLETYEYVLKSNHTYGIS